MRVPGGLVPILTSSPLPLCSSAPLWGQAVSFDDWATPMYALMAAFSPLVWVYFILIVMVAGCASCASCGLHMLCRR